jgi:hypothetical protein
MSDLINQDPQNGEILDTTNDLQTETQTTTKAKRGNIPKSDPQILYTGQIAVVKFAESQFVTKLFTHAYILALLTEFGETLTAKNQSKTSRSPVTQELSDLNETIDSVIENIKGLLIHKYGRKSAVAYYGSHGIQKNSKTYKLPRINEERLQALNTLITELEKNEIQSEEYGLAYWTNIRDRFDILIHSSGSKAGIISQSAARKNEIKKELCESYNVMIHLIRANFRKEAADAEIRAWGFQRERY